MAVTSVGTLAQAEASYGNMKTTQANTPAVEIQVTPENTEAVVRDYFSDIPIMIQVARCESTFQHTLADGSVIRGKVDNRDTGVMQINTYYHGATAEELGLNLENIYDNLAYARMLYEKQGIQPWMSSAPCWSRELASR
jgi:hypothetical protein